MTEEEKELEGIIANTSTISTGSRLGHCNLSRAITQAILAAGYTKQPAEKLVSLDEQEVIKLLESPNLWSGLSGSGTGSGGFAIFKYKEAAKTICSKFGTPPPTEMVEALEKIAAIAWEERNGKIRIIAEQALAKERGGK